MPGQPVYPEGGGGQSLHVAIAHLEVLLDAIASFDGKSMFLSGLNVVVLSAQIGLIVAGARDEALAVAISGLVIASLAVLSGFWDLWGAVTTQFPSPKSLREFRTGRALGENELAWAYLAAIEISSSEAADVLARKIQRLHRLLVLTAASLALVIASAIPSAF